jgi:hypothetical protein
MLVCNVETNGALSGSDVTACPVCPGTGLPRRVSLDGSVKVVTYVCDQCHCAWTGSERYPDKFGWSNVMRVGSSQ